MSRNNLTGIAGLAHAKAEAASNSAAKCSATMLAAMVQAFSSYRIGSSGEEKVAVMFTLIAGDVYIQTKCAKELLKKFAQDSGSRLSVVCGNYSTKFSCYTADVSLPMLVWLIQTDWIGGIELTAQLKPLRDVALPMGRTVDVRSKKARIPKSNAKSLMGVIDFGFPFANSAYINKGGETRVHAIWDQDHTPEFADKVGTVPDGFGYGRQLDKKAIQGFIDASKVGGSIDEDRVYREAVCPSMRARITHGSSSIAILAANKITPSYDPNLDGNQHIGAENADIVFIQVPYALPLAPCAGAAEQCILDGIFYLLECASKSTQHIVVSIGYGSYIGPHDGSSMFEQAVANLVFHAKNYLSIKLDVVFASGNGYNKSIHACSSDDPKQHQVIDWWVPPYNAVPTFADAWLALSAKDIFSCQLTDPSGQTFSISIRPEQPVIVASNQNSVIATLVLQRHPNKLNVLITVPSSGLPGRWRIEFITVSKSSTIHVNTAWGGRNPSFYRRALQGKFLLPRLNSQEQNIKTAMFIDGNGSMISSACNGDVWLVGGYELWGTNQRAKYSGAGFAHGGVRSNTLFTGVDILAPCEESPSLPGLLCAGTRSANYVRENGTSVAAPLFARGLVNGRKYSKLPKAIHAKRPGFGLLPRSSYGESLMR